MADKKFGVKQINLIGASGTPTLTSPNNLNINATTVAISTDVTVGGQVLSEVIVGSGYSVGIGTTRPSGTLDVLGNVYINTRSGQNLTLSDDVTQTTTLAQGGDNFDMINSVDGGNLNIQGSDVSITAKRGTNGVYVSVNNADSGSVVLRYQSVSQSPVTRLQTASNGVTVTGTTNTNQLVVSGISTLGASTVFTTVDNLGNIGIGTNRAINDYSGGNSVLSIHGRTWPGNPTVAGSGLLRIYSNETLLGSIYGSDLTGIGFGRNFNIDSAVPMSISCGTTIGMYGTTEIQQLKVTGVSTFSNSISIGTTAYFSKGTSKGIFFGVPPFDSGLDALIFVSDTSYENSLCFSNIDYGARFFVDEISLNRGSLQFVGLGTEKSHFGGSSEPNYMVGIGTTNPTSKLTVREGDISVGVNTSTGLILTSPNGTAYRLVVDDSGNLTTTLA